MQLAKYISKSTNINVGFLAKNKQGTLLEALEELIKRLL